jgi:site-specific DNA recombinase
MARKKQLQESNVQTAVGYIRVSTKDQADSGLSLDAQVRKIEEFCKFKNIKLNEIIRDEDVSASIPLSERPGGRRLTDLAKSGGIAVVAIKLDRLFRDAHDCLGVTKIWDEVGTTLLLLDIGVDTTTAMGRAFLTNAATYAELERNLISERTREALHQIKIDGGVLGSTGFGWARSEELDENGRRKVVIVKTELETLVMCKTLRAQGHTLQQIADILNAQGVKTKRGTKWYPSTVRNYCAHNTLPAQVGQNASSVSDSPSSIGDR